MRFKAFRLFLVFCISSIAFAEIEKIAVPTDQGIGFRYWPNLNTPEGFGFNEEVSIHTNTKMFLLNESSFESSEAVIYAKAITKHETPKHKTLQDLIDNDAKKFKSLSPKIKINSEPPVTNSDHKEILIFSFTPLKKGSYEYVGYLEESDFYLIFVLSARSAQARDNHFPVFKQVLEQYFE